MVHIGPPSTSLAQHPTTIGPTYKNIIAHEQVGMGEAVSYQPFIHNAIVWKLFRLSYRMNEWMHE